MTDPLVPAALDEWERLARAVIATRLTREICDRSLAYASASSCERVEAALLADLKALLTPERILGLIAAARAGHEQEQNRLAETEKNQQLAPQTRGKE